VASPKITRERAELIAKAHACPNCGEYSFKRVAVGPAGESQREALKVSWQARMICGVCGANFEIGIDDEGEVVYAG
jgi:transcription elongation factor Elf1